MEKLDVKLKIICEHCKKETEIQDLEYQIRHLTKYEKNIKFEGALLEKCDSCNKKNEVPVTVLKKGNVLKVRGVK